MEMVLFLHDCIIWPFIRSHLPSPLLINDCIIWPFIRSHLPPPLFIHDCPGGVCYICEFNLILIQLQCRTRACDHIRVECAIYVLCGTCVWYMCVVYMCVCGVVHVCDISVWCVVYVCVRYMCVVSGTCVWYVCVCVCVVHVCGMVCGLWYACQLFFWW